MALGKVAPAKVACNAFVDAFVFLLKVRDFKGSLGFAGLGFPWQRASIQPPPTNFGDWAEQLHLIRTQSGVVFVTAGYNKSVLKNNSQGKKKNQLTYHHSLIQQFTPRPVLATGESQCNDQEINW